MFEKLRLWAQRLTTRGTEKAYCVRCQAKTWVARSRRVKVLTPKGTSTRLIGRCLVCNGQTSSFVRAA